MSIEHREPPRRLTPAEEFGLTYQERLWDRISHIRLLELVDDPETTVHRIEESHNNYGEYLFVTVSRPGKAARIFMSFYGLGFHEFRERWIADEWYWYETVRASELEHQSVTREAAKQQIEARYHEVKGYDTQDTQTQRGQLFEMIAELTDEDGAWSEMQDLPGWLLDDEDDEGLR